MSNHAAGIESEGNPQFEKTERHCLCGWRDSNHGEAFAIHGDRLAQNVGIAAQSPLPKSVTEERNRIGAHSVLVWQKAAAECRLDTEDFEKVSEHFGSQHALGFAVVRKIEVFSIPGRKACKDVALIAPVIQITGRHGIDRNTFQKVILPNPYEPI